MGKSSGKTPSNQTTTSTVTPYLKGDVNFAASQAKNLYQGYTPEMQGISGQISSLNQQIAEAQKNAQIAPQTPYSGGGMQKWMQYANQQAQQPDSNVQSLIAQRDALQSQLGGMDPDLPGYFPGQTYVDYSPETTAALDMITQRATDGSALTGAANTAVLDTINGKYLDSNPYINNVIDTSLNDVTKRYTDQVLPGLASNFAQSGRYGSGIQQNLTADAVGQLGKEAMGVASGIRYDNYNQERGRQLNAASIAPTLAQADYYDAQQLMGVGSAREALSQAKLQDEMDRFNFYENQPANMLDQYINRISALNSGASTTTQTGPAAAKPSAMGGALTGGAAGLGIGSMMAAEGATGLAALGGPWGIGLGLGGALLGGLFN